MIEPAIITNLIEKRDFKSFQREIKDLFYEKMKPVLEGEIFGQYVNQKTIGKINPIVFQFNVK